MKGIFAKACILKNFQCIKAVFHLECGALQGLVLMLFKITISLDIPIMSVLL